MISFSEEELANLPDAYIGQEINCPHCGRTHILIGGADRDGIETNDLLFYKCFSEVPYLGAVNGRLVHSITPVAKSHPNENIITIEVKSGVIWKVSGLPDGWDYEIIDLNDQHGYGQEVDCANNKGV